MTSVKTHAISTPYPLPAELKERKEENKAMGYFSMPYTHLPKLQKREKLAFSSFNPYSPRP